MASVEGLSRSGKWSWWSGLGSREESGVRGRRAAGLVQADYDPSITMKVHIDAFSDVATELMFDPAAISLDVRDLVDPKTIEREAEQGNLVAFREGNEPSPPQRVYVGEEPNEKILAHVRDMTKGLPLRVPSGTIWVTGAEFAHVPGRNGLRADEYKPKDDYGTKIEVPPGNYLVDCYEVEWDDDELKQELKASGIGSAGTVSDALGRFIGICLVVMILGSPVVIGLTLAMGGWKTGLVAGGLFVALCFALIGVAAAILVLFPSRARRHPLVEMFDLEHPVCVAVLRATPRWTDSLPH